MHPTLQGGLTTPNHQPVITTNTTPLPNHSRHSHPIPPHPMKFRRLKDSNRHKLWTTTTTKRRVSSYIRSTTASLRMASKKRSNYSSAPTFCLIMISQIPTSENFQPPTCLHSSCPCLTPVTSRCHLPFANVRTTHGRYFMGRHFIPLSSSSLKVRSDQPTGLIIKTFNAVTCQPSGPSTLAEKLQTATRPSQIGRQESYTRRHPEERERTTRHCHWGDVSRSTFPQRVERWRQ